MRGARPEPAGRRRLAVVNGSDGGGGQAVGVDHETCQCIADRIVDLEHCAQCADGELIAVDFARRRTCAAEPICAVIIGQLDASYVAGFPLCDVGRDVEGEPVPLVCPRRVVQFACECMVGLWSIGTMLFGAGGRYRKALCGLTVL